MGKKVKDGRKPNGYWNDFENIRKAVLPICEELERFPYKNELVTRGLHISNKITALGGMAVVAKKLGYPRKRPTREEVINNNQKAKRNWVNNNKDHVSKTQKVYAKRVKFTIEGTARVLYSNASTRARGKNIEFSIDQAWVEEQLRKGVCTVSGLPFVYNDQLHSPFRPSIDRINIIRENVYLNKTVFLDHGYTKSNCQVVCYIYNTLKTINSNDDAILIAHALVEASEGKQGMGYEILSERTTNPLIFPKIDKERK